jgi:ACS family D-galactonate transporter-like MFS transporter
MGQALGGFGATVANAYSWQATFQTFGLVGIIYSMVLIFFLKDKTYSEEELKISDQIQMKKGSTLFSGLGILFTNISFWIILFYFTIPSLPGWATKNWLPTLFAENLNIPMTLAGPLSTTTIAASSLIGVVVGGILSDRWVQKNLKGRIYTSAIGLGLTIPSLLLLGFGNSLVHVIGAGVCFGIGFGMFDANNMPIICQFVSAKYRATAYGVMNMTGVFAGAYITNLLGKSTDAGNLGKDFAMLAVIVLVALIIQLSFLRPKHNDFTEQEIQ